jgi:hypothetical protein
MTKTKLSFKFFLLLVVILSGSCNSNISPEHAPKGIKITGVRKFEPFNDVVDAKTKLSQVGIGKMSDWKENGNATVGSTTTYYQFGDASASNNMKNNLSYYLVSQSYHSIDKLMLILNINNPLQGDEAIKMFRATAISTFKQLSTPIPDGLLAAIDSLKYFKSDNDKFSTEINLEKSKIDILKLTIETK